MTTKPRSAKTAIATAIPRQQSDLPISGKSQTGPSQPAIHNARPAGKSSRYIRMAELATTPGKAGLLPVSPATAWRWVREGRMPKPFKLGESVTVWDLDAIDAFIAKRSSGAASEPAQ